MINIDTEKVTKAFDELQFWANMFLQSNRRDNYEWADRLEDAVSNLSGELEDLLIDIENINN